MIKSLRGLTGKLFHRPRTSCWTMAARLVGRVSFDSKGRDVRVGVYTRKLRCLLDRPSYILIQPPFRLKLCGIFAPNGGRPVRRGESDIHRCILQDKYLAGLFPCDDVADRILKRHHCVFDRPGSCNKLSCRMKLMGLARDSTYCLQTNVTGEYNRKVSLQRASSSGNSFSSL